jgi:hypothetical protein
MPLRYWTFDRRLAREAMFIATLCLLMLVLPPPGRLDQLTSPIHLASRSELMQTQEGEFTRWSLNEVDRRNQIRAHLPPAALVMRRVPPLSDEGLAWIYRAYATVLFGAFLVGMLAIIAHSTLLTRFAWLLISIAAAGMCAVLVVFGWPSLFFVIYFLAAVHFFFVAYGMTMLKLLNEPPISEPIRQSPASRTHPSSPSAASTHASHHDP